MNVLLKKRITRYLIVLTTITFMTACTTTIPLEDVPPALFSELDASSDFYLNKDEQLGSDENLEWQFLAIQALIKEKKFVMADAVIESLQTNVLTAEQSATLGLLVADKFYAQNKLPETQIALTRINNQMLNPTDLIHYLKLQATLHIRHELPLEASESLLLLAPRLTIDIEKQAYNDLLLAQLALLPMETLTQYQTVETDLISSNSDIEKTVETVINAEEISEQTDVIVAVKASLTVDPTFKAGWYALAALYQNNKLRPNRLTRALERWTVTYSDHATLLFMPLVLTDIAKFTPYQPDNIAVLLPLSGRFSKPGKAIQLGLLNAYYHQQKSADKINTPRLHFFDTQTTTSEALAVQLKEKNIDFVIGPLMKKEIEQLLPLIENIPVLALNSFAKKVETLKTVSQADTETVALEATENNTVAWHYAFPLSPENEAKQAATMINVDQHKNPLIIVPKSNYGKRVAQAFREQWAALTPTSDVQIEVYYFQSKAKFANFIDDVLQTGKSKRRINQMQAITKISLKTEVRSRRDVDAIYIVSKRDELILLKPFIDVAVSPFAKKIPLYASSRSHSFDRNNMQNKELSRLVFSDHPFLLNQDSALSIEVKQAWKKQSFSTLRLFALGFDSYQLIEQLIYLQNSNDALYKGLIGELRLDEDNSIQAKLSWAKYQNGVLFEVASPATTK
ncbi:penicillin-binding protein activator [Psychromonas hadalis]|uniref:penicillin-binding protein activator n=1 Tax=Psychromonas hadalis TaxID=211669 RepID=UPI0003B434ED|nr:penicillin-binding protein activator [Psychromonas hadalis]